MHANEDLFRTLPQPWSSILSTVSTLLVWGLIFAIIYLLRSFFLLLFLTFVFGYIQARCVNRLAPLIGNRTVRVILVALLLLGILTATGVFLVPTVKTQSELFVNQFTTYILRVDEELLKLRAEYPLVDSILTEIMPVSEEEMLEDADEHKGLKDARRGLKDSPTMAVIQQLLGFGESGDAIQDINHVLSTLSNVGGTFVSIASAFLLSLLFSFLIVLDLDKLGTSVRNLATTKLGFIYNSVADNIYEFSQVLGQALEAQLIISIVNSFLTAIGIYLLGLGQHVAFLSVIVFFCSFVPVIGVVISSIPICLVALQLSGLQTMFLAILLITIIHLIEGYILNPRIYGSYLRINPVIVLIILTIAGKLFNFWGLLLGVPVCTYVFGHAIHFKSPRLPETADAEPAEDTAPPDAQPPASPSSATTPQ
ncbi:MAG: AI-2E family transporter [Desulfobulbus sp.]|jgi:predicted PurR-regulated permease PerM